MAFYLCGLLHQNSSDRLIMRTLSENPDGRMCYSNLRNCQGRQKQGKSEKLQLRAQEDGPSKCNVYSGTEKKDIRLNK